jgi:hypothetical protein
MSLAKFSAHGQSSCVFDLAAIQCHQVQFGAIWCNQVQSGAIGRRRLQLEGVGLHHEKGG